MTIDNFKNIKEHIESVENQFYLVSILRRRKDDNRYDELVKTYMIHGVEKLELIEEDVKTLSNALNARVYISVSRKNCKSVVEQMMHKLVEVEFQEQYGKLNSLFVSAAESTEFKSSKQFIIDVDEDNLNRIGDISDWLNNHDIDYWVNPSVSGLHFITKPFHIEQLKKDIDIEIDVKKNARTLLYYSKK